MIRKLYPVLFVALATVLAFWKVLFHREYTLLVGRDMVAAYYPWFDVASYWLKRGTILLWDPYVFAGKPFMGEPQPGMFYPLNWIVMLLPSRGEALSLDAMQALLVVDYFLAGLFFYWLARDLDLSSRGAAVAAVGFALGGYTVQIYGYVNMLGGFVWMPLVLLFFRRALLTTDARIRLRCALLSGACLALSFLPGHHAPPIHSGLLLFFYASWVAVSSRKSGWSIVGRTAALLAGVALAATLITAVQWLPSLEWARQVYRWVGGTEPVRWGQQVPYSALAQTGNLDPQNFLSLLLPYVSTNANLYAGPILVFLALVGVLFVKKNDTRFFGFAAFLYLFLSLGHFSALHGWVNTFIPGVWFAREVFSYLIPFQACLALLAGWGLDHLVASYQADSDRRLRAFVRRSLSTLAVLVLLSLVLTVVVHFERDVPIDHPHITRIAALAIFMSALGVLLFLMHTGQMRPSTFSALVVAAVLLDLSSHLSADLFLKRPPGQESGYVGSYWKESPAVVYLAREREREFFRVDDPTHVFPHNFGDVWRLQATMGHAATALVSYFDFRGTGWGPSSNASALLNARYALSKTPLPWMKKVFEDGQIIYENPRAVPRAFVARRYHTFSSRQEILSWIQSPLLAPAEAVLFEQSDLAQLPPWFLRSIGQYREVIEVRDISYERSAEKEALTHTDEESRTRVHLLGAPWGWSAGDRVSFEFRPERASSTCFLILNYYPTSPKVSRLTLALQGPGNKTDLRVELPGSDNDDTATEQYRYAVVELGTLDNAPYRASLERTDACSANIDSIRISISAPGPDEDRVGSVTITSYEPHRINLLADLRRPSFVVVSEIFYPGWKARLDGRTTPLLNANYILRAIAVPAGIHRIELRYRPATLLWGLLISGTALVFVIVALALTRRRPAR